MKKRWAANLFLPIILGLLLSSCATATTDLEETMIEISEETLRPYPSDTPSATPWPTGYNSPTLSPTITPTATPVYYEIQLGDDMTSIAWRYNISPQAIMTANPTVNPNAMIVGEELLIPVTPLPEVSPTPTPALSVTATPPYAALQSPDCYPDALGGLWCFALVENDQSGALENVSGVITLKVGEETRQEMAILPLNLLPVGESLPLIAYFQPPTASEFSVSASVDFLLPVMPDDQRYLDVEIINQTVKIADDAQIADITGDLRLTQDGKDAEYIWVSATAFDVDGRVVGVRRWDSMAPITAGVDLTFNLMLYSMGGRIEQVKMVVEARAVDEP